MFDDENLWGETPAWALDDAVLDGGSGGDGEDGSTINGKPLFVGAQHVLFLVDCHHEMFGGNAGNNNSSLLLSQASYNDSNSNSNRYSQSAGNNYFSLPIPNSNAFSNSNSNSNGNGNGNGNDPNGKPSPMDLVLLLIEDFLRMVIRTTVTLKTGKRNGIGMILYHTKPHRQEHDSGDNNDNDENDNTMHENDGEDGKYRHHPRGGRENVQNNDDDDNDDDSMEEEGSTVHVLIPLVPPGADQVRKIRSCLLAEGGERDLKKEFCCYDGDQDGNDDSDNDGSGGGGLGESSSFRLAPLQTALEEAMRIFRKAKCVKTDERRVVNNSRYNSAGQQEVIEADSKSIWIFTNRSNPYPETSHLIQNVAKDAKEQGIEIVVWPMQRQNRAGSRRRRRRSSSAGGGGGYSQSQGFGTMDEIDEDDNTSFDYESFYQQIVSTIPFQQPLQTLDEMQEGLEGLKQLYKKIRPSYHGPLVLPDWRTYDETLTTKPSIMVDWFRMVQMAKKPTNTVAIDQRTKRAAIKVRHLMDQNSGEIFATFKPTSSGSTVEERANQKPQPGLERIRTFSSFGGELIKFTQSDVTEIKHQANGFRTAASLTILGFQPKNSIPYYHTMAQSYLLYPNDVDVQGSREAFIELHAAMLRKKVLAIGEAVHRLQWTSRLVSIVPVEEVLEEIEYENEDGTVKSIRTRQKRPPGMLVTTLPFEDDMRQCDPDGADTEWQMRRDMAMSSTMAQASIDSIDIHRPAHVRSIAPEDADDADGVDGNYDEDKQGFIASKELVNAASALMKRQIFGNMVELGEDFDNAALEEFYNYLEAVALELPVDEDDDENDDENHQNDDDDDDGNENNNDGKKKKKKCKNKYDTILDEDLILKNAGKRIERFVQYLPKDDIPARKKRSATTRTTTRTTTTTRKRKATTTGIDENDDEDIINSIDWDFLCQHDELHTCKVLQLKSYLRVVGEPVSGNKSILVDRVRQHILCRQK